MFEFVKMYKYNKIAQNLTSKQLYLSRKLDSIAQGLDEKYSKRNSLEIGKYFIYKGKPIKIISGYFIDPEYDCLSNYWTWRKVLSNGSLGKKGEGYGGNDEVFKPITKQEAIKLAKKLRRKMILN
jgi:hypothetical protein